MIVPCPVCESCGKARTDNLDLFIWVAPKRGKDGHIYHANCLAPLLMEIGEGADESMLKTKLFWNKQEEFKKMIDEAGGEWDTEKEVFEKKIKEVESKYEDWKKWAVKYFNT